MSNYRVLRTPSAKVEERAVLSAASRLVKHISNLKLWQEWCGVDV